MPTGEATVEIYWLNGLCLRMESIYNKTWSQQLAPVVSNVVSAVHTMENVTNRRDNKNRIEGYDR